MTPLPVLVDSQAALWHSVGSKEDVNVGLVRDDESPDALEHSGDTVGWKAIVEVLPLVDHPRPDVSSFSGVCQRRPQQERGVLGSDRPVVDFG